MVEHLLIQDSRSRFSKSKRTVLAKHGVLKIPLINTARVRAIFKRLDLKKLW